MEEKIELLIKRKVSFYLASEFLSERKHILMKVNRICCIGAGYVGGPTMAVIALKCPEIIVTVVDIDQERIDAWNSPLDKLPVFEPGLAKVGGRGEGKKSIFLY